MKKNTLAKTDKIGFNLAPTSLEEAMSFSKMIADSDLAPPNYRGKPGNVLVAIQMGYEVNLQPMQAIQNIAIINGRPSVWGDAIPAIIKASPAYQWMSEWFEDDKGNKVDGGAYKAICVLKRKGHDEQRRAFSVDEAKTAKLWGKSGPWTQYPDRMLQMRARSFAARDVFPDALKGFSVAEEATDIPIHTGAAQERTEPLVTPAFEVPEMPALDSSTEKDVDAQVVPSKVELIERIGELGNKFEADNWLKKHRGEIDSLGKVSRADVMVAYGDRFDELEGATATERDFSTELQHAENLEMLDQLWADFSELKPTGVKVVKMRRVRDLRATEIKGKG